MPEGKRKGDAFENRVCRQLSYWYTGKTQMLTCPVYDLPFRKRSTSIMPVEGHWNGHGDILHRPSMYVPFSIECKKREGWVLDGAFAWDTWEVAKWWQQASRQAERAGLEPLLVFNRNRRPVYVMLTENLSQCLKLKPKNGPALRSVGPASLVIALLADLVESQKPEPRRKRPHRQR